MSKENELFKSSLKVPVFKTYNKAIFNLLHTPEYENYTDVVLSTLGQELEQFFKPKEMSLKYRYKSLKSFENNIKKDSKVEGHEFHSKYNKYINYDIIGMRLVINKIPEDFTIDKNFIDNCKKDLKSVKQQLFELENKYYSQNIHNNDEFLAEYIKKSNKLKHEIEYLENCCNFDTLLLKRNQTQKILSNLNKNSSKYYKGEIEHAKTLLNNLNNTLGMIAGDYVIDHIIKTSPKLKQLGIYLNDDRKKFFYDDTGYTAVHFCLESSKYPLWRAELQDRSSEVEYLSKFVNVTHNSLPGKKRRLENLPAKSPNTKLNKYLTHHRYTSSSTKHNTKAIRKFLQKLDFIIPLYTKYTKNGYIKKYTKSENVRHYYKKLLLENFEYDKNLKNFLEETTNDEFLPELNGNRFNDEKTI